VARRIERNTMSAITHVTDADFTKKVLQSDKPVLVDFWAEWCGPCRMIAPVLEEIAGQQDKLDIVKLNTDENPETVAAYRITSIPALKVFSGGQVVREIIGAKPKAALLRDLDGYVN
jgi:thioredoxin 1